MPSLTCDNSTDLLCSAYDCLKASTSWLRLIFPTTDTAATRRVILYHLNLNNARPKKHCNFLHGRSTNKIHQNPVHILDNSRRVSVVQAMLAQSHFSKKYVTDSFL